MTVTMRCAFEEDNKLYPQVFQMKLCIAYKKCCNMIELIFQKELTLIKQVNQKNICFVIIGIS